MCIVRLERESGELAVGGAPLDKRETALEHVSRGRLEPIGVSFVEDDAATQNLVRPLPVPEGALRIDGRGISTRSSDRDGLEVLGLRLRRLRLLSRPRLGRDVGARRRSRVAHAIQALVVQLDHRDIGARHIDHLLHVERRPRGDMDGGDEEHLPSALLQVAARVWNLLDAVRRHAVGPVQSPTDQGQDKGSEHGPSGPVRHN
mmetsp:Transcript_118860/g.341331  ORF Transcript_118860/g.341331 Transcript_118860/m.341331 type:complete len:203 (+) Transcript_118860:1133-1741(+)